MDDNIRVTMSPSGLYEATGCPRHLWLKHRKGISLPDRPFPGIFNTVDRAMKGWVDKVKTSDMGITGLPEGGQLRVHEGKIQSQPLVFPDLGVEFVLGGYIDAFIAFPDGSVGIVDNKFTTEKKGKPGAHATTYSGQLGAYTHICEHAATSVPGTEVVSTGLICFAPDGDFGNIAETAVLSGKVWYVDIPCTQESRDDFVAMIRGLAETIASPTEPPRDPNCSTCRYEEKILAL